MESNGEPLKIHISPQCRDALDKIGGYVVEERGPIQMKGKGTVNTFWLVGATEKAIQKREVCLLPIASRLVKTVAYGHLKHASWGMNT
jgi:hypothetical protein